MSTNVLMTLSWPDEGDALFPFSINTAAFENISRIVSRRWAVIEVLSARPLQQDTGPGLEEMRLDGTVYPHWRGGLVPLEQLRRHVTESGPALMLAGTGEVMGYWTLLSLDVRGDVPTSDGIALRQRFSLNLAYYGETPPPEGSSS
ncbi:MAG: phage tail protein [Pseudomonadota bacterium]